MRCSLLFLASGALFSSMLADAGQDMISLKGKIRQSLESLLESRVKGIENCQNKCDKAFNRFAYEISTATARETFEFKACVQGCEQCNQDLAANADSQNCFRTCKDFNWDSLGIVKGVIEPDKACIGGCVINTCQVICNGGTTDSSPTQDNKQFFYPNGGCSIKTQPYSQYLEYVPWNSPTTGQGGSQEVARCCANALSLCEYVGNKDSTNYRVLLSVTGDFCQQFTNSRNQDAICAWFNTERNCGSTSNP